MPRVLIADDNSNIQKMVSLALKDAGIEVIGVNNGEAAVRKMPEILPDLVLADIFMPVRSGYEVCEFVKKDPRFAHVPVILLAGAFDPFDELEAKRVRADGVLKKPFVPPDPLLSMVTSLLTKAGERLVPVGAAASRGKTAPVVQDAAPVRGVPVEEFSDEPPVEFKMPTEGMAFADDKTLAFGSLLESPAAPEVDSAMSAMRDPGLADSSLWHQTQAEEFPSVDELPGGHSWDELVPENTGIGHTGAGHVQPAEMGLEQELSAMEFSTEELEMPAAEDMRTAAKDAGSTNEPVEELELPLVAQSPFLVEEHAAHDLKTTEAAGAGTDPAEVLFSWPALPVEETPFAVEHEAIATDFSRDEDSAAPVTEQFSAIEPEATSAVEPAAATAFRQPLSSQIPELGKLPGVSHLAETVNRYIASESKPAAIAETETVAETVSPALSASVDVPQAVAGEPLNAELLEAVVARVIDRMQPQMIEIVTREILRPVVEALVRRELEKK